MFDDLVVEAAALERLRGSLETVGMVEVEREGNSHVSEVECGNSRFSRVYSNGSAALERVVIVSLHYRV